MSKANFSVEVVTPEPVIPEPVVRLDLAGVVTDMGLDEAEVLGQALTDAVQKHKHGSVRRKVVYSDDYLRQARSALKAYLATMDGQQFHGDSLHVAISCISALLGEE